MNFVYNTEWLILIVMLVHLIIAPFTKVEESFNIQAVHDILYHRFNISNYDHLQFPGVVPRTFAGAIAISSVILPFIKLFEWYEISKYWVLLAVRLVLGCIVLLSFCNFTRSVQKHFGCETACFLRLIVASQFHFLFYSSRSLPNTFALIGVLFVYQLWLDNDLLRAVQVATVFTVVFRCELILLFGTVFIVPVLRRQLPIFCFDGGAFIGIISTIVTLCITVPIDSLLWSRFLWPEGEVAWFNIILNKSHEYGVLPFFWYFYSVLPRALITSLIFVPLGMIIERRLFKYVLPIISYIILYSFLPHKELRFIIYTFPILNLAAAIFCARLWVNRNKNWFRYLISLGVIFHLVANSLVTAMFLYASAYNYPGGDALGYLQFMQRFDRNKPVTVYIDNFSAQTGVNRFLHLYEKWEYNKTENLTIDDLKRFDFLLLGTYSQKSIIETVKSNFSSSHRLLYTVKAFQRINFKKSAKFPYFWPVIKLRECLAVLVRLEHK